ncbi:hypothetical protein [uncultured Gimesia sp.]|uniref:hypothetical protein n=1 Tax=uncultured Gimesia sp. TaxID=1678688 RepID=UPI0030D8B4A3
MAPATVFEPTTRLQNRVESMPLITKRISTNSAPSDKPELLVSECREYRTVPLYIVHPQTDGLRRSAHVETFSDTKQTNQRCS